MKQPKSKKVLTNKLEGKKIISTERRWRTFRCTKRNKFNKAEKYRIDKNHLAEDRIFFLEKKKGKIVKEQNNEIEKEWDENMWRISVGRKLEVDAYIR